MVRDRGDGQLRLGLDPAPGPGRWEVRAGDCVDLLRAMPEGSVDSIVTDPPAGIAFMGREWDRDRGGRDQWIAWMAGVARECLRVIKPGAFAFVWCLPKTSHWTATAFEEAGFIIKEKFYHLFGSGFPKGRNIGRELSNLPWCTCGCEQVACPGTKDVSVRHELLSASDADPAVLLDRFGVDTALAVVDSLAPPECVGTGVGAALVSSPRYRFSADHAGGFRQEFGGCSGHRCSAVDLGVKTRVGQGDPVVLGTADMTGVAECNEVAGDVGLIGSEPEPLRDDVVGEQIGGVSAVETRTVAADDVSGNVLPATSSIGPLSAAPGGVVIAGKSIAVCNGHANSRAVNGRVGTLWEEPSELGATDGTNESRGAALRDDGNRDSIGNGGRASARTVPTSVGLCDECSVASWAGFGNHEDTIRGLVSEGKVSVCGSCCRPRRPSWITEGLNTATKPAVEEWILAQRPISEATIAANVLKHGTGALNIDGCRVAHVTVPGGQATNPHLRANIKTGDDSADNALFPRRSGDSLVPTSAQGRWPSNLILGHHPDCRQVGGPDSAWACHPDCPTRCFPETASGKPVGKREGTSGKSGIYGSDSCRKGSDLTGYGDAGSAARFFQQCADDDPEDAATRLIYVPKASRSDRNEGCENLTQNNKVCTTEGWENEDQRQHGQMDVTSPARDTCEGTSAGDCGSSTSSCGNSTMDQCPLDTRCTTSTATSRTIESRTYPSSVALNTSESTPDAIVETMGGGSGVRSVESGSGSGAEAGTSPQRDGPCTGSAGSATSDEPLRTNKSADGASERKVQGRVGRNTHPT